MAEFGHSGSWHNAGAGPGDGLHHGGKRSIGPTGAETALCARLDHVYFLVERGGIISLRSVVPLGGLGLVVPLGGSVVPLGGSVVPLGRSAGGGAAPGWGGGGDLAGRRCPEPLLGRGRWAVQTTPQNKDNLSLVNMVSSGNNNYHQIFHSKMAESTISCCKINQSG